MWACRPTRFGGGASGSAGLPGRPYRPPLRRAVGPVRRAGCPHPAKAGRRNHQASNQRRPAVDPLVGAAFMAARAAPPELPGLRSTEPGQGGMWACRPTRFGGGASGSAGLPGRPYRPPLRRAVGPVRRAGCPHPAKAGRRNHQASNQRRPAVDPLVGAAFMAARAAPPELPGLRSTEPGQGGMWACRPTRFGGGAVGSAGLFGRPYRPPLQTRPLPVLFDDIVFITRKPPPDLGPAAAS